MKKLIARALAEDIGAGDITTDAVVPKSKKAKAILIAKSELVVAGVALAADIFKKVDKKIKVKIKVRDGNVAKKGAVLAEISGPAKSILEAERTVLNFLQRLSGIATLTKKYANKVKGTKAKILDTRKTTPGFRLLEKYAVKCGGGTNHRIGLYDMYLVKNNHIDAAGSITDAVENIRSKRFKLKPIEVEVRNFFELLEALSNEVDIIMLDHFSPRDVVAALKLVKLFKIRPKIEVSGNIDISNIRKYASLGVDFISVGALTHSAPSADVSLHIVI